MKPIIRWTIWQRRLSIVWWSVGIISLLFITMIFYPSFHDQAKELEKTFDQLPDAALQLFGGSADFFSPVGFMNSQIFFITLPIVLGILAISLGNSLIGREEQDGTLETLLAHPVTRTRALLAKATAGILVLTIITIISLITIVATGKAVDLAIPATSLTLATLDCGLLALSLGAIAFLLTTTGRARAASLGITAFIGLGGYVISSLAGTVEWLKVPAKVFPFHYYDPESILRGHYSLGNTVFFICLTLACGLLAWLSFRRRDIG